MMLIFLSVIYVFLSILIFLRIKREFDSGFDLFSFALYVLIFLISCGILYVLIFGLYYLAIGMM